jgi:hypothetical protein
MMPLPETKGTPAIRTDFSDDGAWAELCGALTREYGPEGFAADLDFIDDPAFDGMEADAVLTTVPADYPHGLLLIVDAVAFEHPDHPVLVVELDPRTGDRFRVVPASAWSVENNLSLCNMDWQDFAESVDSSGIFRGF